MRRSIKLLLLPLAVPLLLAGCVANTTPLDLSALSNIVVPPERTVDYRTAECQTIWELDAVSANENALYWLRMMDCAQRLNSGSARKMAQEIKPLLQWEQAFRQSILISSANPSLSEKRKMSDDLNQFAPQAPISLRPLLALWREQLQQSITLGEERQRYRKLQSETDNKVDRLNENNARLVYELQQTSRKLESLTKIERQLSSRKQNSNADVHLETQPEIEAEIATEPEQPQLKEQQVKEQAPTEKPTVEKTKTAKTTSENSKPDNSDSTVSDLEEDSTTNKGAKTQ